MTKFPMTVQGARALEDELKHLKTVLRPQITQAIAEAGTARIDLADQTVQSAAGVFRFDIAPEIAHRLRHGLDDIGITLQDVEAIDRFEASGKADHSPVTSGLAG